MQKHGASIVRAALKTYDPPELKKLLSGVDDISISAAELIGDLEDAILEGASAGAFDTAAIVGVSYNRPPAGALAYARRRAALLVGMKRTDDGGLIPNPNTKWNITETIRDAVRSKVSMAIDGGWSPQDLTHELGSIFDLSRAETIARTETGFAYNAGAKAIYEESGQEFVGVVDGDGCTPHGHDDNAPEPSGEPGLIEEDALANGQVWRVADIGIDELLGHPRCVRYLVPHDQPPAESTQEETE